MFFIVQMLYFNEYIHKSNEYTMILTNTPHNFNENKRDHPPKAQTPLKDRLFLSQTIKFMPKRQKYP